MAGVDALSRTMPLSVWAAGTVALLLFVALLVIQRGRGRNVLTAFGGIAFIFAGAILAWIALDWAAVRDRTAERRALDQRLAELANRAVAPNAALACLDAIAGDAVETACEKAVFASPEAAAAAVSYVASRMALLADAASHIERGGVTFESSIAPTRLALETDRFGIVAHILAMRDNCTPLQCDALTMLRDPTRVEANLRERTFDAYVTRHTASWSNPAAPAPVPTADASAPPTLASTGSVPAGVPMSSRYDFPSAASIPPVSIMNPEPANAPAAPSAASPPATTGTTPVPPRRPPPPRAAAPAAQAAHPPAAHPPAAHPSGASGPPVQLAPPASSVR